MARSGFFLFVDEVKPTPPFTVYNFTGIAVEIDKFEQDLKGTLNKTKNKSIPRQGGQQVNLHFTSLARNKDIFSSLKKNEELSLWAGIIQLLKNLDYRVLAGVVDQENYKNFYPQFQTFLPALAFKLLIQNFARFLSLRNGFGYIVVESGNDDECLKEEYYRVKFAGSDFLTSECYKQVLRGIDFVTKKCNNEGLQVADLIANPVSRMLCGLMPFKPPGYEISPFPEILDEKIYKGPLNMPMEFGIRKVF